MCLCEYGLSGALALNTKRTGANTKCTDPSPLHAITVNKLRLVWVSSGTREGAW
jgi:hypothetical protein